MSQEPTGYRAPITAPGEFDKNGELTRPIWPVFACLGFIFAVALVVWLVRHLLQS